MALFDAILQQYGTNEPIFSAEISFKEYSRPWIFKQLNQLCEEGKLQRFEKGVYYIPTETIFGKSLLNPRKVIERKYILQDGERIGYYTGISFQNQLCLTTQMPSVVEICTNNETTRVRDVQVGKQKVLLRKARTQITSSNVDTLSFLELMNEIKPDSLDAEKRAILVRFITERNITRKDITAYAPFFPDRAMRNLVESEVIYSVAQ